MQPAPVLEIGSIVVVNERLVVQHPLPRLRREPNALLLAYAGLLAGDLRRHLGRDASQPTGLGEIGIVDRQRLIDEVARHQNDSSANMPSHGALIVRDRRHDDNLGFVFWRRILGSPDGAGSTEARAAAPL